MVRTENVFECPELRGRTRVFRDRAHAGDSLAPLLEPLQSCHPVLFAVPAGGVPVAVALARRLGFRLDVAPVSKITLPFNTEVGYGAVAFDGTVRLNAELVRQVGLSRREIQRGIRETRAKVQRRAARLRGTRRLVVAPDTTAILVDDGLASGFTMLTAAEALRNCGARSVMVAVPTGHSHSIARLAPHVDKIFCANVRSGMTFAVADAYQEWYDVSDEEAERLLAEFRRGALGEAGKE